MTGRLGKWGSLAALVACVSAPMLVVRLMQNEYGNALYWGVLLGVSLVIASLQWFLNREPQRPTT